MTLTFTTTETKTFTRTSARYIASKVAADLHGFARYYGRPTVEAIRDYEDELISLLLGGYVDSVEYGFRREGKRVVTLLYRVRADGSLTDTRPGSIFARANTSGASWFSFLVYSARWYALDTAERDRIRGTLPFQRTSGSAPQDGSGSWTSDRSYSANGVGAQRNSYIPSKS
jgi:hypothetical protein